MADGHFRSRALAGARGPADRRDGDGTTGSDDESAGDGKSDCDCDCDSDCDCDNDCDTDCDTDSDCESDTDSDPDEIRRRTDVRTYSLQPNKLLRGGYTCN